MLSKTLPFSSRLVLMKPVLCWLLFTTLVLGGVTPKESKAVVHRPKLILLLVIDQFRSDYLTRLESKFLPPRLKNGDLGGFRYLMTQGAYFPQAEYEVLQSVTCVGHATILTGSYPYQSGIPNNYWVNPENKKTTYCVLDENSPLVGAADSNPNTGRSPKNLRAGTVGDEIKNEALPSRGVSIAIKDRSAILMGGHQADLALWFHEKSKQWISSKHYLANGTLPEWINRLNVDLKSEDLQDIATPAGARITLRAAKKAMEQYHLGSENRVDVLSVSLSSHDVAGHRFGPNSSEVEQITLGEDRVISELLNYVKNKVPGGLSNVLFVLTGDHGVSPSPEWSLAHRSQGGRLDDNELAKKISEHLNEKFGPPHQNRWIMEAIGFNYYLNQEAIQKKGLTRVQVEAEAKSVLLKEPGVSFVITRSEVASRTLPPALLGKQILNTYIPDTSGDLILIPRPGFVPGTLNSPPGSSSHATGYSYDRTVPIIMAGFHIRPGLYATPAHIVDIAPTISFLTGILPPNLSEGRVLSEAIQTVGLVQ